MAALFRFKCPCCGEVCDSAADSPCPKCKNPLPRLNGGYVQIYRMGSPIGIGTGYGIYINGQPFGHLGNKQSVRIPLPFGSYTFHFTCGMTRKCNDITVTLTPENPISYVKAHIVPGFWTNKIVAEFAQAQDMPPID